MEYKYYLWYISEGSTGLESPIGKVVIAANITAKATIKVTIFCSFCMFIILLKIFHSTSYCLIIISSGTNVMIKRIVTFNGIVITMGIINVISREEYFVYLF